ncbi:MAG TPA: gluconokinase [Ktedonobacterales bacterium]|nr:gluconokinase [Ktedonobacterales bacterium]
MQPQSYEAPLILTIDAGTSSVRALLYDRQGRQVEGVVGHEPCKLYTSAEGAVEEHPDEMLARIERCIDEALQQAGPRAHVIGGVACDTLASTILAIDKAGKPITPLITYADTRNAADSVTLRQQLDERNAHDRTGCMLRSSYWPARLAWFRRTQPDIWRSAARWLTLGEYLELRLFGQSRVSYSIASWTGLLDRRKLVWDAPLLEALGLTPEHLSPLVDRDEALHGLAEAYAARWPALRDVPWFPAIGDGAAANVGSGCVTQERIALTIGTSGAMREIVEDVPQVPAGLWLYRVDRRRALLGGATSEGGNVYAWMKETLHLAQPDEVEKRLEGMEPDNHGLTVLPLLAGERSPGWAGDAKAAIVGLSLSTSPEDILRASLEAVAYRFGLIARSMGAATDATHRFIASGGGLLHSSAWMQIFADVLGRPVVASEEAEATSRGAALLALEALKIVPAVEQIPAEDGVVYQPNPAHQERYRAAVARQQRLYEALIAPGNPT